MSRHIASDGQTEMAKSLRATKHLEKSSNPSSANFLRAWFDYGHPVIYGRPQYFCPVVSIFFFSSPNLSGHRLDVYHTSTHGVALVRI